MNYFKHSKGKRLPAWLSPLFWEHNFKALTWDHDRDLITARILSCGDWDAISWLRTRLGDDRLASWLTQRAGAGLSPQQLRFWELILGLPHRRVNLWLSARGRTTWDNRMVR
jgi:hypothetical protein